MALAPGAHPRYDRPSPCILNLRAEGFQRVKVFILGMLLPSAQTTLSLIGISILSFIINPKAMPPTLSCQAQIAVASLSW